MDASKNLTRVGEADGSGQMFDRIASRYDLLNRIISFGIDRRWRAQLLRELGQGKTTGTFLDVATGTADVALAIAGRWPEAKVIGLDPSVGMLEVGRQKVKTKLLDGRVELVEGDAQKMAFADNSFSGACISFGIRNVPDRLLGLKEMSRVVEPGGKVAILELSEPPGGIMGFFAKLHVHHFVPWLGALLSGSSEYRYLQASIAAFPPPEAFVEMMQEAGLHDIRATKLTFGTAHLYVGTA